MRSSVLLALWVINGLGATTGGTRNTADSCIRVPAKLRAVFQAGLVENKLCHDVDEAMRSEIKDKSAEGRQVEFVHRPILGKRVDMLSSFPY